MTVKIPVTVNGAGSMGCVFFTDRPVRNYADAASSDTTRFAEFHRRMLRRGVYLAPSQFEAFFVSTAHSDDDIARIIDAASESFAEIAAAC